ncbi:MazG-like family protein [Streptomyces sp. NPDC021224]|uniref:MazG-like family protein n=1 Tax=unclassified Streptomyces TaxID=2593676 RepID=UPI0037880FA0
MNDDIWATVGRLVRWLDENDNATPDTALLLRLLKLQEEAGEVAQAAIGATGGNPRKGHSHTWEDVQTELCDVMLTAMVALTTLTPDAADVFAARVSAVADRSLR